MDDKFLQQYKYDPRRAEIWNLFQYRLLMIPQDTFHWLVLQLYNSFTNTDDRIKQELNIFFPFFVLMIKKVY